MRKLSMMGMACVLLLAMMFCGCGGGNATADLADETSQGAEPKDADQTPDPPLAANTCTTDADCVPATCCHPKTCVAKSNAPKDCGDMMCTMDCADGTMDCGAGKCACQEGVCAVEWK